MIRKGYPMKTKKTSVRALAEGAILMAVAEILSFLPLYRLPWGGSIDFTDVLLLLKIDGKWKCVAKAYNQNSNTIK